MVEPVLNAAATLIREAGDFTRENERLLDNLRNIDRYFQEVRVDESLENPFIGTIESVCKIVLFSGYIPLKCCTSFLSKVHHQIQATETNLPECLRPKVTEITSHFENLINTMTKIDSTIYEAKSKIEEFSNRSPIFNMSRDEKIKMEMLMRNLQRNLAIAKNYLNMAEEALQSLNSGKNKYLLKEAAVASGATAIAAGAVAGICTAATMLYEFVRGVQVAQNVARNAALAVGAAGIVSNLLHINKKYDNYKTTCNKIESQLNILKAKYCKEGELTEGVKDDLEVAKREAENIM